MEEDEGCYQLGKQQVDLTNLIEFYLKGVNWNAVVVLVWG
jgi:hypothetical protein